MFYVYVYCDPTKPGRWGSDEVFHHEPFYVGEGTSYRMFAHFSCSRNPEKSARIAAVRDVGLEPIILKVKDGLSKEQSRELEARLIADLGTVKEIAGIPRGPLTNKNKGGGGVAAHSQETREKMRLARTGRKHAPETIEKMRATKSKGCTEEKLALLSANRKSGRWMTKDETTKYVRSENIDTLLAEGFRFGMKARNKSITHL